MTYSARLWTVFGDEMAWFQVVPEFERFEDLVRMVIRCENALAEQDRITTIIEFFSEGRVYALPADLPTDESSVLFTLAKRHLDWRPRVKTGE